MSDNIKREDCEECKDLLEGETVEGHDHTADDELTEKKIIMEKKSKFNNPKLRILWNVFNEHLNGLYAEKQKLERQIFHGENMCDYVETLDKE